MSVKSEHFVDADGNSAGGTTYGTGFAIGWQNGPLGRGRERKAPNGATVEDVIQAVIDRLLFYEKNEMWCHYNKIARHQLWGALETLRLRTADRESRGVEGTHEV